MENYSPKVPLEAHGLYNAGKVNWNLHVAMLVQKSLERGEGTLATNGALVVNTTPRTGRSPKDKFVVCDEVTEGKVDWTGNKPIKREKFEALKQRVLAYLQGRELFVFDGYAGADVENQVAIRVINEYASHNMFVHQMFRRVKREDLIYHTPEYTIISAPGFHAVPERDGTTSEAFVILDLEQKVILIGGTKYAGEMKKSIFSVLNYIYPQRGIFPMHCSANIGEKGDTAVFFGLSGTGKTTLSADPNRRLIGDDEHGWGDNGVFNFEGGCYAKVINLSRKKEPQIWDAIRFGCLLENVVLDPAQHHPLYDDDSITENTRAAYPLEFIDNAVLSGIGGQPNVVIFLTADAFGILPPVARLSKEQAMYHFLSGYTARLAGTETGMGSEAEATFSTCFGAPFLPLAPTTYAKLLGEKLEKYNTPVYLVNTGWTGGAADADGERFDIPVSRAVVTAAISGEMSKLEFRKDDIFGFDVPVKCPGVPDVQLTPRETWKSKEGYDNRAKELAKLFNKNFEKFAASVTPEVMACNPKID